MLTLPPSKVKNMAHMCLWGPDIQVCGTHRREDLVNATISLKAEEKAPTVLFGGMESEPMLTPFRLFKKNFVFLIFLLIFFLQALLF